MAFRRLLSKRLYNGHGITSHTVTLEHSPIPSTSLTSSLQTTKATSHRDPSVNCPDSAEKGFFRRFLHRGSAVSQFPEFLSLPLGDKLREKLRGLNEDISPRGDRLRRLDGISPAGELEGYGVSVEDARKLLRVAQVEKLKVRVRELGKVSVSYSEFVRICRECCGGSESQATEFADLMDRSGHVIVLGHIVFLRPEQVAKSMENLISESMATPHDPRREQLTKMEMEKSIIDKKARTQVTRELYCGLGFLMVQMLGFMRLTFWELSWDVMEPICFFVTNFAFALAYGFFLRTSTEPSFEGYFYRRFRAKQKKLMKAHNFDIDKYMELKKAFYPSPGCGPQHSDPFSPFFHHQEGFANYRI